MSITENRLYYGDNLDILQRYFESSSVDLIYLDPPFNSDQNYNILFEEKNGSLSKSQIKVFKDTWHWSREAEEVYRAIILQGGGVAQVIQAFRSFLGSNDMMAYLVMMAPRLMELRRVLKPTGSIYLHCDSTASHYLKLLMDSIFLPINFRNEIIWRRTGSNKSNKMYGPIHQTILFYAKTNSAYFKPQKGPYTKEYVEDFFREHDDRGGVSISCAHGPGEKKR
ncbi:MAG: hypothetical protein M1503_04510 [Thaumarchaeota archaeon]|nr:hypothetical protein [Nitrososphaerota archaeon]MCL5317512.1 hypothetical protein [Nitrososphaerota archaeon]